MSTRPNRAQHMDLFATHRTWKARSEKGRRESKTNFWGGSKEQADARKWNGKKERADAKKKGWFS